MIFFRIIILSICFDFCLNLEQLNRQRVKFAGVDHPELQLNGHFGLPVYQHLPIRRGHLEHGHVAAGGFPQFFH